MRVLIGNFVKTDVADYPCSSREEAEALYMALRRPHPARDEPEWTPPQNRRTGEPGETDSRRDPRRRTS